MRLALLFAAGAFDFGDFLALNCGMVYWSSPACIPAGQLFNWLTMLNHASRRPCLSGKIQHERAAAGSKDSLEAMRGYGRLPQKSLWLQDLSASYLQIGQMG
jgi:hypothetical protein